MTSFLDEGGLKKLWANIKQWVSNSVTSSSNSGTVIATIANKDIFISDSFITRAIEDKFDESDAKLTYELSKKQNVSDVRTKLSQFENDINVVVTQDIKKTSVTDHLNMTLQPQMYQNIEIDYSESYKGKEIIGFTILNDEILDNLLPAFEVSVNNKTRKFHISYYNPQPTSIATTLDIESIVTPIVS